MKCRYCSKTVPDGYGVKLGRRHGFCSKSCMERWSPDRVLQLEAELNRIYVLSRGKAREIAKHALQSNLRSEGSIT